MKLLLLVLLLATSAYAGDIQSKGSWNVDQDKIGNGAAPLSKSTATRLILQDDMMMGGNRYYYDISWIRFSDSHGKEVARVNSSCRIVISTPTGTVGPFVMMELLKYQGICRELK